MIRRMGGLRQLGRPARARCDEDDLDLVAGLDRLVGAALGPARRRPDPEGGPAPAR